MSLIVHSTELMLISAALQGPLVGQDGFDPAMTVEFFRASYPRGIFPPRTLHPGPWWVWALGCAVVATRTTNPILLALVILVASLTVVVRRTTAPWAMAFRLYVYLGVLIVVLRVGFRVVFGANGPTVLFRLPTLTLGSVRLFGPVAAEALAGAGVSGLQLATMILAVGAANALANPKRLLACVPGALYEWGTVVVIAISVFPQLAESIQRVRRARQLRGETGRGVHLIRNVAMPVLSDALDRSLLLAGAMDSRGYGRSALVTRAARHTTSALLLISTVALSVGAYALLDPASMPLWMGVPMVVMGLGLGVAGLRLSGRRVTRSRYRPDPFAIPEWVVLSSGVLACVSSVLAGKLEPAALHPTPFTWPPVGMISMVGVGLLALPSILTPRVPDENPDGEIPGEEAFHEVALLRPMAVGGGRTP